VRVPLRRGTRHPAWSGLPMNSKLLRRAENQDVEFVHATRMRPFIFGKLLGQQSQQTLT
jgi:hypothetical protein